MADLNWNLLQPANPVGALLGGYEAGQKLAKQRGLDAALGQVDLTRPETILPVLRYAPDTGSSLLTASAAMAKAQHETAGRAALADAFSSMYGGGALGSSTDAPSSGTTAPSATSSAALTQAAGTAAAATALGQSAAPAQPSPAGGSSADPSGDNAIVVTGHPVAQMRPTMQQAVGKLMSAGVSLDDATKFVQLGSTMTKAQSDQMTSHYEALDAILEAGKDKQGDWLPPEQLKGLAQANRSQLIAQGIPADVIDGFDGSPQAAQIIENRAAGAKAALEAIDKNRSFALDQARFGETQRHDRADEATAAANAATSAAHLGIDRAQLGVAQGHLALDQQAAKLKAQGPAGGGIATPTSAAEYNALPAGTRYFKNGQIRIKQ